MAEMVCFQKFWAMGNRRPNWTEKTKRFQMRYNELLMGSGKRAVASF